jgi:hypothetical protein
MPITNEFILAGIILGFVVFAAVLAWGEYQTRHLIRHVPRRIGKIDETRAPTMSEIKTARQTAEQRALIASGSRIPKGVSTSPPVSVH